MSWIALVLGVLLAVAVVVCGLLAYRLGQLRRTGTPVLLRELPADVDEGWRHGTVHYSDENLRYFRLSSLRPGPTRTLGRQSIEITRRRRPEGTESEILHGMVILELEPGADDAGRAYELAMAPGADTAFQSWLESRQSNRSQRRRSA
ncbi:MULTISPECIES: DUF2550 domain-containing protein [Gordonia]|uniref:DUF2550 domain-containing protein n=1 Tax=Gordonia hankookensis TaxID=589403 RepID=A0ABR7WDE8_9ACTN|nr:MULTISPECIES: DUF2550 domain-containing protein [Gordonia]MYR06078.1 DUF2550 family protein [Gordonia sp. SID5947]NDZ94698.1 DUF2550 domain-containing protein [Streptomyces sp. SID11726]NEB24907.1 DUF2550 domain-containing protein [Streptomyces sp. SID6673]MBD1320809.1 DUF2550 domain-containing protein [Gordonia hankookensis]WAC54915.1 DUF2550 domain-containing protein [Gordonia sp. SL306]